MNVLYTEKSQTSKSGMITIGIFIIALLLWMAYTINRSIEVQALYLADLLIEVIALLVIIKQARSHYTYILTDKEFIIEEIGLLRKHRMTLPYEMIDGVYAYRREVFGQLKFRYKYRKVNSLDPRFVWALAYSFQSGKKIKHGRVLIKAEDEFFETLEKFLPDRIRVDQEKVVFTALLREEAFKYGSLPEEYLEQIQVAKAESTELSHPMSNQQSTEKCENDKKVGGEM